MNPPFFWCWIDCPILNESAFNMHSCLDFTCTRMCVHAHVCVHAHIRVHTNACNCQPCVLAGSGSSSACRFCSHVRQAGKSSHPGDHLSDGWSRLRYWPFREGIPSSPLFLTVWASPQSCFRCLPVFLLLSECISPLGGEFLETSQGSLHSQVDDVCKAAGMACPEVLS